MDWLKKTILFIFLVVFGLFYPLIIGDKFSFSEKSFRDFFSKENSLSSLTGSIEKKLFFSSKKKQINILGLGRPGQGYPGGDLTDTLIIAHLDLAKKKVWLISLPRDFLVSLPAGAYTKINHLYSLAGPDYLKKKVEEITGLKIDYYIVVDLVAVKEIVDLVGGVNIYVPENILDRKFPGPNYSYQVFSLPAGWRYLDGQTALKYIRTRHQGQGDFDRMWRQQQVLKALQQKVFSLNLFRDFDKLWQIFQNLRGHLQTDLSFSEIHLFWQLAQKVNEFEIIHLAIDSRTGLLSSGRIFLGNQPASMIWPKAGWEEYEEIRGYLRDKLGAEMSNQ